MYSLSKMSLFRTGLELKFRECPSDAAGSVSSSHCLLYHLWHFCLHTMVHGWFHPQDETFLHLHRATAPWVNRKKNPLQASGNRIRG